MSDAFWHALGLGLAEALPLLGFLIGVGGMWLYLEWKDRRKRR